MSPSSSSPMLAVLILLMSVHGTANYIGERPVPMVFDPQSTYQKPTPLARDCIRTIQTINELAVDPENSNPLAGRRCIGCVPVQKSCPPDPDCQALIDDMYVNCADNRGSVETHEDGVTLPDGYFYDPQRTIGGTWNLETKEKLRIAIGRCGCSSASGLTLNALSLALAASCALYFGVSLI
ncbi:hypothetical protein TrVE_jg580 [Triparma verrucosa]|uniref:Uncharacterized protein n=2 Tax=Triparma TaxID=722752 RepID=A0A9W7AAB1_9STRA|nr:hypothetical protein TrST_g4365 [Triparma strigata]GMI00145.1 hypothetical protein TrVE_jg580 [Triparma verrucosa]